MLMNNVGWKGSEYVLLMQHPESRDWLPPKDMKASIDLLPTLEMIGVPNNGGFEITIPSRCSGHLRLSVEGQLSRSEVWVDVKSRALMHPSAVTLETGLLVELLWDKRASWLPKTDKLNNRPLITHLCTSALWVCFPLPVWPRLISLLSSSSHSVRRVYVCVLTHIQAQAVGCKSNPYRAV